MVLGGLLAIPLAIAVAALAGCTRTTRVNEGLPLSSTDRCYQLTPGVPVPALDGNPAKLDPDLRTLLAHRRAETVRVTVEFRGELGDLEAVGFIKHSLVAHPTRGYKIATGTIPVDALEPLSAIEHLTLVSVPVLLRRL